MEESTAPTRRRRPRWLVVAFAVAVAVAVAAAVAWPSLWRGAGQDGSAGAAATDVPATGLAWFPAADRAAAPGLSGSTLDGGRLSLADLRGHVVVVNVWGSWCAPCRDEAPDLARLARKTDSEGVRFLGIDTRDNKAAARAFVRSFDIPYPSLFDPDGRIMLALNGIIPISAVPSTVVIDKEGRVAARVVGKVTYDTLRGLINDVQASSQPADRATSEPAGA